MSNLVRASQALRRAAGAAAHLLALPRRRHAAAGAPPAAPGARDGEQPRTHPPGRRVLVVDDNVDAATTLAQLVELLGHASVVVHDGLQAIEAARRAAFDIVLLDLGMPRLDGIETARRLRTVPGGETLYIAAVTGWGQDADRARTRDAGFDLHLVKPVDIEVLTQLLERPRRA